MQIFSTGKFFVAFGKQKKIFFLEFVHANAIMKIKDMR